MTVREIIAMFSEPLEICKYPVWAKCGDTGY
jgi:hypothetical protein